MKQSVRKMLRVPFNKPCQTGSELTYLSDALNKGILAGDSFYGKLCQEWFEKKLLAKKTFLTPSCTAALELAALALDIRPGDEIIMPSFTFVSTANAFVLRGAKIVFVDVDPETMNIQAHKIEKAITDQTRCIVPVHYAGVGCDMELIMEIANRHKLAVVEDAAQAFMNFQNGRALGTFGNFGTYSFHETKNITSGGEGGLLIVNQPNLVEKVEILREKGTDRSKFFRGMVDKYSWVDVGSSLLPSEIQAAYLYAQLNEAEKIREDRVSTWMYYYTELHDLKNQIILPPIPESSENNGHMFYIKVIEKDTREHLINYLKDRGVMAVFHYVPLHSSKGGLKFSRFSGEDKYTTFESERLIRLPIWFGMTKDEKQLVVESVRDYFNEV